MLKKIIKNLTQRPLQELNNVIKTKKSNFKIPPVVYQTWINKSFGKDHYRALSNFRKINPNLSFYIFNEFELEQYMHDNWKDHKIYEIFKNCILGPLKTDIFRYCILYQHGGYYFDISRGCSIPLQNLHTESDKALITYEDTFSYIPPDFELIEKLSNPFNHFLQWGLGFESNHMICEMMIKKIIENYPFYKNKVFENPKLAILNFSGPGMYTKVLREYLKKYGNNNIAELGVKFNGKGIFKLKGANFRYYQQPSYTYLKNSKICC